MIIRYLYKKKFSEIKEGCAFIYEDRLFLKGHSCNNINAMRIDNSVFTFFVGDTIVTPVESEIYVRGSGNDY